jgi:hypothetical protein
MDAESLLSLNPRQQLRQLALEQQQRLMEALTLTAGREKGAGMGGFVYQLAQQVSVLNQWLRGFDNGVCVFSEWAAITQEAAFYWDEWYDWYSRFYTRREGMIDGLSLDDMRELGGLEQIGLASRIIHVDWRAS